MLGVKYVAPVFDSSGYGNASREYIYSLHNRGVPITVVPHCFERNQPAFGDDKKRRTIGELLHKELDYQVVLSQLTPDMALAHREEGKYNISYFAWETSKVHPQWVACLNQMDEVWVPCEWNVEAVKSSGVTKPVFKIPHGIDVDKVEDTGGSRLDIGPLSDDTFVFYNISQWNPRKNPEGLLRAYFNAFKKEDNVALVLKTYVMNGSQSEAQFLADQVKKIKQDMDLDYYPKVVLITSLLTEKQVLELHNRCDCLVSLHYSEGWGLVPFDAGLAGKPVIATGATGNMEYMTKENSYPVDYRWAYVSGMSTFNRWYRGDGLWAEPHDVHAAELMRHVFENQREAAARGNLLKEDIKEKFSWDSVAQFMIDRLNVIGGTNG